jgi:hypothetical protein
MPKKNVERKNAEKNYRKKNRMIVMSKKNVENVIIRNSDHSNLNNFIII